MTAANYQWKEGEFNVTRTVCWSPPGCHGGCGILLYTKGGKLVKVKPDPGNHFSRGRLCVRAPYVREAMYHPDRLTHPLLRAGARGENKWRKISFAEALDISAARFLKIKSEFGPESVIFCKGTARDIGAWLPRLAYGFGSPNYFGLGPGNGNACYRPRVAAATAILGSMPVPDLGQFDTSEPARLPDCLLVWGCNPTVSNPDGLHGGWVTDAMKQGTALIVVDPQTTPLAQKARFHLKLKPGSDAALALGMIHVLFAAGLIDEAFCRDWVLGLDAVKTAVASYTPDRTSELTGIDPDTIVEAAKYFGRSAAAGLVWGVGVDMNPGCLGTIHALISLMTLTGNIENPGGMLLPGDPFGVRRRGDNIADFPQVKTQRIGAEKYPLLEVGNPYAQPDVLLDQMETGEPYPIKAAWIQGAGVVPSGFADPERVLKLFKSLDFTVMVDIFLNPAAVAFADLVLPAAMYPEKDSLYVHFSELAAINKTVEPPGECRSDAEIILAVGKRIAPDAFPWDSVTDWLEERLKPSGMTFAELRDIGPLKPPVEYWKHQKGKLRSDGQTGFSTPSGRIELQSSIFKAIGLVEVPRFDDCLADYRNQYGLAEYPFILTTGARKSYYFAAEHRNIAPLRRRQPEPQVQIHPDDAGRMNLNEGDDVRIFSPFGSCLMKADLSERFAPGVIHCDAGWWFSEVEGAEPELFDLRRSNVNALFPSGLQGPGGFGYPFRCFVCNIEKVTKA